MSSVAEQLAYALGGRVVALPGSDDAQRPKCVIELPDARVPVLIRKFGHAVGVCVDGTQAWRLAAGDSLDDATCEAVVAAVQDWAAQRGSDALSLFELALRLTISTSDALGQRWTASFPGTAKPREAWLHEPRFDAAAVGVFPGRVVVDVAGRQHAWKVRTRGELIEHTPAMLAAVRAQLVSHDTNVELSARVRSCADALAAKLAPRLGHDVRVDVWTRSSHWRAAEAWLRHEQRELASVRVEQGQVTVHAGLLGDDGWHGHDIDDGFEALVAAIELAARSLTIERLRFGQRYRVLADIGDLRAGKLVRLDAFDDIDNHYGVYRFSDEHGNELSVGGDYSTPRNSPLGPAYRYLEPID